MKSSTARRKNFISVTSAGSAVVLFLLSLMFVNNPAYAQKIYAGGNTSTTYGVDASGTLYAWGKNSNSQVGDGTTTNAQTPIKIAFPIGVTKWLKISGGTTYVLAIGDDNNLYAWGQNNYGQSGQGSTSSSNTVVPTIVSKPTGVTSWTAVSAGNGHCMALGNDGNVYTWGYNSFGQIGNTTNSTTVFQLTLFKVTLPGSVTATAIAAGDNSSFALGSNSIIYSWGRNANGQLGISSVIDSYVPVAITLPSTPVAISSGTFYAAALCSDGNIYGWGSANNGQLGNGSTTSPVTAPVVVIKPSGVASWKSFSCGASFALGIADNGLIYGWGLNDASFELGVSTGSTTNVSTAVNIVLPSGVVAASVTASHNSGFIVDANNNVYGWGLNTSGQVGINSLVTQPTPAQVLGVGGTGFLLLPVELTSFTSSINSLGVNLKWTTATEVNNSGFDVERATDKTAFEKIGSVKGSGNSTSPKQYSFTDKNNLSGNIQYRLKQIDNYGAYKYSQVIAVNKLNEPISYKLGNYPNPFNPSTIIRFELPENTFVNINVYNMLGKKVATLINQKMEKGIHEINFKPEGLATGIYVYQMNAGSKVITQKMTLLK